MAQVVSPEGNSYGPNLQEHRYITDGGTRIAPCADRTGNARLIRVHSGWAQRVVEFKTSRGDSPPLIPIPETMANDTIMSHTLVFPLPTFDQQQGRLNFSASGQYTYLQNTPRVPGVDAYQTGRYPYPIEPIDTLAGISYSGIINNFLVNLAANSMGPFIQALAATIDVTQVFSWYVTTIPPNTFTTLISG